MNIAGKSGIHVLQEYCFSMNYSPPLFLERSNKGGKLKEIKITCLINRVPYATSVHIDKSIACELSAIGTLSSLINNFDATILKRVVDSHVDHDITSDKTSENAVSLLYKFINSLGNEASGPEFEFEKQVFSDNFTCNMSITINSQQRHAQSHGRSKLIAKREACHEILRSCFKSCNTIAELAFAVDDAIASSKARKVNLRQMNVPIKMDSGNDNTEYLQFESAKKRKVETLEQTVLRVIAEPKKFVDDQFPAGIHLRLAQISDAKSVFELVHELAAFEMEPNGVKLNFNTFQADGWIQRSFWVYVAEVENKDSMNSERMIVAIALFYPVYSTWEGVSLHLEDLFVKESFRHKGIGNCLLKCIFAVAVEASIPRTQWTCLDWNTNALNFYKKMGSKILPDWRIVRIDSRAMSCYLNKSCDAIDVDDHETQELSWSHMFEAAQRVGDEQDANIQDSNEPNENYLVDNAILKDEDYTGGIRNKYVQPATLATFVCDAVHHTPS